MQTLTRERVCRGDQHLSIFRGLALFDRQQRAVRLAWQRLSSESSAHCVPHADTRVPNASYHTRTDDQARSPISGAPGWPDYAQLRLVKGKRQKFLVQRPGYVIGNCNYADLRAEACCWHSGRSLRCQVWQLGLVDSLSAGCEDGSRVCGHASHIFCTVVPAPL